MSMEPINLQIVKLLKADELLNCKICLEDDQIVLSKFIFVGK